MVPVLVNGPRSGPLGGVNGRVLYDDSCWLWMGVCGPGTTLIVPSLILDQFSGPVVVPIIYPHDASDPGNVICFRRVSLQCFLYIRNDKKCGFARPSNKLEDEFCSYYSSSVLASSSLLDNTAGIIQTRECDVKGEGPSNIWTGLRVLFFSLFCVSISVKQTERERFPCCSLLYCLMIYRNYNNISWCFSARTKLLFCEQRGLHSPLFSNPSWTFLQMSRRRGKRWLRGERWPVLTGRADTVRRSDSKLGNTQQGWNAAAENATENLKWIYCGFMLISVFIPHLNKYKKKIHNCLWEL